MFHNRIISVLAALAILFLVSAAGYIASIKNKMASLPYISLSSQITTTTPNEEHMADKTFSERQSNVYNVPAEFIGTETSTGKLDGPTLISPRKKFESRLVYKLKEKKNKNECVVKGCLINGIYLAVKNLVTSEEIEKNITELIPSYQNSRFFMDRRKIIHEEVWLDDQVGFRTVRATKVNLLKWSSNEDILYGVFNVDGVSGDPAFPYHRIFFEVNINTWNVNSHPLSGVNIGPTDKVLNTDRRLILYGDRSGTYNAGNLTLHLNLYDLSSKATTSIVSYSREEWFKNNTSTTDWWCQGWWPDACSELQAEWIDKDTVSYFDAITQKSVLKVVQE